MTGLELARLWMLLRPVQRIRQWRTKRKMQSWAEHHLDEVPETFNSDDVTKEVAVLQGKLTYSSIAVLALSWLAQRFDVPLLPDDATALISAIGVVVGTVGAIYGRYRATKAA